MRRSFLSIVVCACVGFAVMPSTWAQTEGSASFDSAGTSAKAVTAFLAALQKAVAADDRDAVAGLFSYPARVPLKGRSGKVKNKAELTAAYADIFDPGLKKLIADARLDQVFANSQGVMIGNGRLWFSPVGAKGQLAIITINSAEPATKK